MLFEGGRRLFDNVLETIFILPDILIDKNPDVFARHIRDRFRSQVDVRRLRHKNKALRNFRRFVRPFTDSAALWKNFLHPNITALTFRAFAGHPETGQPECQFRRVTDEMRAVVVAVIDI